MHIILFYKTPLSDRERGNNYLSKYNHSIPEWTKLLIERILTCGIESIWA